MTGEQAALVVAVGVVDWYSESEHTVTGVHTVLVCEVAAAERNWEPVQMEIALQTTSVVFVGAVT